jgi:hypothetical protein
MLKVTLALSLVVALSSQAFADDLSASAAQAAQQQAQQQEQAAHRAIPKAYLYGGTALFAGGITAAIYGFLHQQNTGFAGYKGTTLVLNEASATNTLSGPSASAWRSRAGRSCSSDSGTQDDRQL